MHQLADVHPDSDAAFLASHGLTVEDLLLSPAEAPLEAARDEADVEDQWHQLQEPDLRSRDEVCAILGIPNAVAPSAAGWTYSQYMAARYEADHEAHRQQYAARHPLLHFCTKARLFELWSQEYVEGLAAYLKGRLQAHDAAGGGTATVLEVGAGCGQLLHHLQRRLQADPPALFSSGSWAVIGVDVAPVCGSSVIEMDYRSALRTFQPTIVLCAWMPRGQDWTWHFRQCPSVVEYILIGEIDDGCCGHPWWTWGFPGRHPNGIDVEKGTPPAACDRCEESPTATAHVEEGGPLGPPPYTCDGFARQRLQWLSDLQLSRTTLLPEGVSFSHTVSFTRNQQSL
eukprot:GGOE01037212.1.p1 GENE.GGOE01037212.1~~GGOE01037212.1.p1  ORF type:complete len:355 (+),score=81.59 GGOE01037212.1:41-1066(+)